VKKLLQSVKFDGGEETHLPSSDELAQFEAVHGLDLPGDYRDFLLKVNGGMPFPNLCLWPGNGDFVAVVFGFNYADDWMRLDHAISEFDSLSLGYLPVAISNGGNYFLLSLSHSEAGGVHFWDHELEDVNPISFNHLIHVSPSFSNFINSLVDTPAEDESVHPLDI